MIYINDDILEAVRDRVDAFGYGCEMMINDVRRATAADTASHGGWR
jgi:hypothetical protein